MTERIFKGIANHASGFEEDFLQVSEWEESPDDFAEDLKAGMLSMNNLVPPELRVNKFCAEYGEKCFQRKGARYTETCPYRDKNWICRPPRFKFKITVETEEVKNAN